MDMGAFFFSLLNIIKAPGPILLVHWPGTHKRLGSGALFFAKTYFFERIHVGQWVGSDIFVNRKHAKTRCLRDPICAHFQKPVGSPIFARNFDGSPMVFIVFWGHFVFAIFTCRFCDDSMSALTTTIKPASLDSVKAL